jgi:hypothetical protein
VLGQLRNHLAHRHVRYRLKALDHKCTVRLKQPLAMSTHPVRCSTAFKALAL